MVSPLNQDSIIPQALIRLRVIPALFGLGVLGLPMVASSQNWRSAPSNDQPQPPSFSGSQSGASSRFAPSSGPSFSPSSGRDRSFGSPSNFPQQPSPASSFSSPSSNAAQRGPERGGGRFSGSGQSAPTFSPPSQEPFRPRTSQPQQDPFQSPSRPRLAPNSDRTFSDPGNTQRPGFSSSLRPSFQSENHSPLQPSRGQGLRIPNQSERESDRPRFQPGVIPQTTPFSSYRLPQRRSERETQIPDSTFRSGSPRNANPSFSPDRGQNPGRFTPDSSPNTPSRRVQPRIDRPRVDFNPDQKSFQNLGPANPTSSAEGRPRLAPNDRQPSLGNRNLGPSLQPPWDTVAQEQRPVVRRGIDSLNNLAEAVGGRPRLDRPGAALVGGAANWSEMPSQLRGDVLSPWRPALETGAPTFSQNHVLGVNWTGGTTARPAGPVLRPDMLRTSFVPERYLPPPPVHFRPVIQPVFVQPIIAKPWCVPSTSFRVSFVGGRGGFSWNYFDGRFRYDNLYVSAVLAPLGFVSVSNYDGFFVSNRYFCHGYGFLDGVYHYGHGRIWVPGFWAPRTVEICDDTIEWIPPVFDWVWTGADWEWTVVDGGYYATRRIARCRSVTRWVWVPGHWQRAWLA